MAIEKYYQQIADTFSCFLGKDKKQAFYTVQQEANTHNAAALYIMGLYFEGGYGIVSIDKACAENFYQKAAQAGDAVASLLTDAGKSIQDRPFVIQRSSNFSISRSLPCPGLFGMVLFQGNFCCRVTNPGNQMV